MATVVDNDPIVNVTDYLLGINDLNRPKVIDMSIIKPNVMNSAIIMIARLIYLKPGTYPDLPNMGIDIIGRYRFSYEEELSSLASDIEDQVSTYLPEFVPITVNVGFYQGQHNRIEIKLTFNETEYSVVYNTDTYSLEDLLQMQ